MKKILSIILAVIIMSAVFVNAAPSEEITDELIKFGIKTEVFENSVEIFGGELKAPCEILCGHNDHRIVMSLVTLCTLTGGIISGAEAVAKSFPDYFQKIKTLGIGITDNETE